MDTDDLVLALIAVLIIAAGAAIAIALLMPPAAAAAPELAVSLTDIYDVIADAARITREAAP